jgi:hypothetical protein
VIRRFTAWSSAIMFASAGGWFASRFSSAVYASGEHLLSAVITVY